MTPEQRAARRDSLTQQRAEVVKQLMAQIAGRDSQPATQVFKNVQLLKDQRAGQLLTTMDAYGRALSVSCAFCHVPGEWDKDDKQPKATARIMINMVNAINSEHLVKLAPGRGGQPRRIGCTTCHRGNQTPGTALLP
jgi:hypothetical protein